MLRDRYTTISRPFISRQDKKDFTQFSNEEMVSEMSSRVDEEKESMKLLLLAFDIDIGPMQDSSRNTQDRFSNTRSHIKDHSFVLPSPPDLAQLLSVNSSPIGTPISSADTSATSELSEWLRKIDTAVRFGHPMEEAGSTCSTKIVPYNESSEDPIDAVPEVPTPQTYVMNRNAHPLELGSQRVGLGIILPNTPTSDTGTLPSMQNLLKHRASLPSFVKGNAKYSNPPIPKFLLPRKGSQYLAEQTFNLATPSLWRQNVSSTREVLRRKSSGRLNPTLLSKFDPVRRSTTEGLLLRPTWSSPQSSPEKPSPLVQEHHTPAPPYSCTITPPTTEYTPITKEGPQTPTRQLFSDSKFDRCDVQLMEVDPIPIEIHLAPGFSHTILKDLTSVYTSNLALQHYSPGCLKMFAAVLDELKDKHGNILPPVQPLRLPQKATRNTTPTPKSSPRLIPPSHPHLVSSPARDSLLEKEFRMLLTTRAAKEEELAKGLRKLAMRYDGLAHARRALALRRAYLSEGVRAI